MAKGIKPTYNSNLIEEIRKGLETIEPVEKQKITTPGLIHMLSDDLRQKLDDGCTWGQLAEFLKDKGVEITEGRLKALLPKKPGGRKKRQSRRATPSAHQQPEAGTPASDDGGASGEG